MVIFVSLMIQYQYLKVAHLIKGEFLGYAEDWAKVHCLFLTRVNAGWQVRQGHTQQDVHGSPAQPRLFSLGSPSLVGCILGCHSCQCVPKFFLLQEALSGNNSESRALGSGLGSLHF